MPALTNPKPPPEGLETLVKLVPPHHYAVVMGGPLLSLYFRDNDHYFGNRGPGTATCRMYQLTKQVSTQNIGRDGWCMNNNLSIIQQVHDEQATHYSDMELGQLEHGLLADILKDKTRTKKYHEKVELEQVVDGKLHQDMPDLHAEPQGVPMLPSKTRGEVMANALQLTFNGSNILYGGTVLGILSKTEDGYFNFWPDKDRDGYWPAHLLISIGEKLNDLNKEWDAQVKRDLAALEALDKSRRPALDPPSEDSPATRAGLLKLHERLCSAAHDLLKSKNQDYAGGGDPYANFRGSATFGIHPIIGILLRMQDKAKRVESFALKGELQVKSESVTDSLVDLINYSVLIAGMIEADRKQV
jgi:hypothetical protein